MPAIFDNLPLIERNDIRLIELSPGHHDQFISCTLFRASLNGDRKYQALSYVWGEPDITTTISLNGRDFEVTKNLWDALRSLRLEHECRILWIDALCIDQGNRDEKAWQVSLMGQIFRNCEKGLLWIGEEFQGGDTCCISEKKDCHAYTCEDKSMDEAIPPSMDRLHPNHAFGKSRCVAGQGPNLGNALGKAEVKQDSKHPDCRWHGYEPRISTIQGLITSLEQNKHLDHIPALYDTVRGSDGPAFEAVESLLALGAFMNRKWWTRSWTVQEAVLPPISLLRCGSLEFSFESMTLAADHLYFHSRTCCSSTFTRLAQELDDLAYGEATINILFKFQKCFKTLALARSWINIPGINLLDFLYIFHDREAKDDRDKVFALLGMLPPAFEFRADYSVSLVQLHKSLSFNLLARCPDKLLSVLWRESPPTSAPSWIKDFGYETTALNRRFRSELYNASKCKPAQIEERSNSVISAVGVEVDTVYEVSSDFRGANTYSTDQYWKIVEWAQFLSLHMSQGVKFFDDGTLVDAFFKTLTGDMLRLDLRFPDSRQQNVYHILQSMARGELEGELNTSLAQELKTSVAGRKLFITRKGRIGLGPCWMQKGDEVWVLFGGAVPFVLRPIQNPEPGERLTGSNKPRSYRVIGDGYVHGIMFGEAVDEVSKGEVVYLR